MIRAAHRPCGRILLGSALLGTLLAPALPVTDALDAQVTGARSGSTAAPERRIEGHVRARAADGGTRLGWAMIEVDGVGRVLADSAGAWSVSGVAPGLVRVVARSVGFAPAEVEIFVPRAGVVTVDLELAREVLELPGIVVAHDAPRIEDPSERSVAAGAARALVRLRGLEASPGLTEAGLGSALAAGGEDPGQPGGRGEALYLRGSASDLKLVLLDGAPIYTPFHLGGLLPSFDGAVLGAARHHVGGAPARYDGGLSYILDMQTRSPRRDRAHARGWADILSAGGTLDVPLGQRSGALLSARTLHGMMGALTGGSSSPYGYYDGLARIERDLGETGSVFLTGFVNQESVFLDLEGSEHPPGAPLGDEDASWGNTALSLGWTGDVDGTRLDVGAATSAYRAELPMYGGIDVGQASTPFRTILATGRTERKRVTVDAVRPGVRGPTRFGLVFDRTDLQYGSRGSTVTDGSEGFTGYGHVLGGYVEGTSGLVPGLDLRWGARVDRFVVGAGAHTDPDASFRGALRAALLWDLGSDALVTLAVGRYHQLARRADLDATLGSGEPLETGNDAIPEDGYLRGPVLSVAQADHVVASLQQRLGDDVRLDTELFYKSFSDVAGIESGSLASSGVELQVLRDGERISAWIGYSLAWFWEPSGGAGARDFSGRHLLDMGVRRVLVGPAHLDVRLSFSDGLPLTSVPVAAEGLEGADASVPTFSNTPNNPSTLARTASADGFLRIDAELFAEWDASFAGVRGHLRPYFKVMNALARRDALFYYFEPWRSDELRPLAELSILPVAGVEWRF